MRPPSVYSAEKAIIFVCYIRNWKSEGENFIWLVIIMYGPFIWLVTIMYGPFIIRASLAIHGIAVLATLQVNVWFIIRASLAIHGIAVLVRV